MKTVHRRVRWVNDTNEIYYGTLHEAFINGNGEDDLFRMSERADIDCRRDIGDAIKANTINGELIHGDWEDELIDGYGIDRICYILAATFKHVYVYASPEDYIAKNAKLLPMEAMEWACTIELSRDRLINAMNTIYAEINPLLEFWKTMKAAKEADQKVA